MDQIKAIEENVLTYYKGIARLLDGRFIENDEIAWFITERQSLYRFNGVGRTATRTENLRGLVDPILETFLSNGLPFFWVDWRDIGTPGLGEYLNSKNIHLDHVKGMPAMLRKLDDLPELSLPKEVEVTCVQSQQDQADWLNVLMEGFDEPEPSRPDFKQFLANSLAEPAPVFEHFLARRQGEPCAISTLLHADQGAGIYHVTTFPPIAGADSVKRSRSPPCNPLARLDTNSPFYLPRRRASRFINNLDLKPSPRRMVLFGAALSEIHDFQEEIKI